MDFIRIAINTAKNYLVAKGRRIQNSDIEPTEALKIIWWFLKSKTSLNPEAEYQRKRLRKIVHDSINSLPDNLKNAIIFREVDGMS